MKVRIEKQNEIGQIVVCNPPVNALANSVAEGIVQSLTELESDPDIRGIVLRAEGATFVAGADIRSFEKRIAAGEFDDGAGLYEVTNRLEASPKTVVCALHGTVFGGGLELAMACHYRIAKTGTVVGQPEVKLGLIPGAGGTQRLPRLCGAAEAARLCALGTTVDVNDAISLGIIDEIGEEDFEAAAMQFALRKTNEGPRRTGERPIPDEDDAERSLAFEKIRSLAKELSQGAQAGILAVDAIEQGMELPIEDGLTIENEFFKQAISSSEARTLIRLFFAERAATKYEVPSDETVQLGCVTFPRLEESDVSLLEPVIRSGTRVEIGDPMNLERGSQLYAIRTPDREMVERLSKTDSVVALIGDSFDREVFRESDFDLSRIIGMKVVRRFQPFVELAVSDQTRPEIVHAVIRLLKVCGLPYLIESPQDEYVSTRIQSHRHDSSDLKIEAWKLLQEKVIRDLSDVDLVNVHYFGHPRHRATVGEELPKTV